MNSSNFQDLDNCFVLLALAFIGQCTHHNIKVKVLSTKRSFEVQNELYTQGRTKKGAIVTNAKGGESAHNYGLAFDVAVLVDGQINWDKKHYQKMGEICTSLGLVWGGSFGDYGHIEHPKAKKLIKEFKAAKNIIKGNDLNLNQQSKFERVLAWLKRIGKQPSTIRGLVLLLSALGIPVSPEMSEWLISVIAGLGIADIFTDETK